eukprot:jgi/Galph1/1195/GphlegSOOS_G5960.1
MSTTNSLDDTKDSSNKQGEWTHINGTNHFLPSEEEAGDRGVDISVVSKGTVDFPIGNFTKDGRYLAVVSPNEGEKLNTEGAVYLKRMPLSCGKGKETNGDEKKNSNQLPSKAVDKVTCLAISYEEDDSSSKTSKRRKKVSETSQVIVAVGFLRGEVGFHKMGGFADLEALNGYAPNVLAHNRRQVTAICFSKDSKTMFSSGHDSHIVVWERSSFNSPPYPKKSILHQKNQNVSFVACNENGTKVAVADTEITLYDVHSEEKILKLRGHANPVSGLSFILDDAFLISCSNRENNAYVWDCRQQNIENNISMDSALEMDDKHGNDKAVNGGTTNKKNLPKLKRSRSTESKFLPRNAALVLSSKCPTRNVTVLSTETNETCIAASTQVDGSILGFILSFDNIRKNSLQSSSLRQSPQFCVMPSSEDDAVFSFTIDKSGKYIISEGRIHKLSPRTNSGILQTGNAFSYVEQSSGRLAKHLQEEREAKVLNDLQVPINVVQASHIRYNTNKLDGTQMFPEGEGEQTLEAKLSNLGVGESQSNSRATRDEEQGNSSVIKQHDSTFIRRDSDSSKRILEQAIIHHDHKLLEKVLTSVTDRKHIQRTVSRLNISYVVPLLRELVLRFESSPGRAKSLLVWIRCIMLQHAGFLSSTGEVVNELMRLHQIIEERVGVFQNILELEGRLELIIAHGRKTSESETNWSHEQPPMFEYDEVSSSRSSQDSDAEVPSD